MDKKSLPQTPVANKDLKHKKAPASATRMEKSVSDKTKEECCSSKKISHEEISLRAYFISERRREKGLEGDCESDWREAEAQLLAEKSR